MDKKKRARQSSRRLYFAILVALLGGGPAAGQVTPIGPDSFGPEATILEMEKIVGVLLPEDPFFIAFSVSAPFPFSLGQGVTLTQGGDVAFFEGALDIPPGSAAWGLGLDGMENIHDVGSDDAIPSGTGWMASLDLSMSMLEIELDTPVGRIGAHIESDQSVDAPMPSLEAFDENGSSLGSVSVETDGVFYDNALDGWIGLSSTVPIKRIRIHSINFVLDDLTFEAGLSAFIFGDGFESGTPGDWSSSTGG